MNKTDREPLLNELPSPASLRNVRRDIRERYQAARAAAIAQFRAENRVEALLKNLAHVTDATLVDAVTLNGLPARSALLAVGGYGRGEQFPYSDVDLLVLLPGEINQREQQQIADFISLCWDTGLDIGHSVRTVAQCLEEAQRDITVQTSLLEARFLVGNRALARRFKQQFQAQLNPLEFFRAKLLEMRQRHAKYEDTPFSLEPNCKESPGGLRDLQVIRWVARAAQLGNSWRALLQQDLVTRAELRALQRNERLLRQTRARLHLVAGRREDRLVFDIQTALATDFGLAATPLRRASEVLMQSYYWSAKAVQQLNTIVLQNIEARLLGQQPGAAPSAAQTLNARFSHINGQLHINEEAVFEREPGAMLEAFLLMQQHPELSGMSARTLRGLWHGRRHINASFRRNPAHRAAFLSIFQQPRGVLSELRRMNQTSILGRYLPAFRRIVGQMQHDLFHAYTVDQHILMVLRNLRRFTMPEHAHEYPLCSQLMADFDQPWLLYIAALFHDIAKGRGGDHSQLGKQDALRFCREHGLSRDNTALVVFLVEHHLTLSQVAQKQDLGDPEVIQSFAARVQTERRLVALYLLTVADIRGTSPKVWNSWKAKLLQDLFHATRRALSGNHTTVHAEYEARQREAQALLAQHGVRPELYQALWQRFDVAFFLRQDASTLAWLTRHIAQTESHAAVLVKVRLAQINEGLQVMVYVCDQPDLFARLCGYFSGRRFSIVDAKVHTTRDGYALDTFVVVDADAHQAPPEHYRHVASLLEYELHKFVSEKRPVPATGPMRIARQAKHFPVAPVVDLRPDDRGQFYLLFISAADRSGLLYDVAQLLAKYGINLHTAKIATLGARVEDVLLIDGAALSNPKTQIQLETELLKVLAGTE